QLERRIRAIGRRRASSSRAARLGVATIGVVVLTAAWVAPRPPVPARAAPPAASPVPSPRNDSASVRVQGPALANVASPPTAPAAKDVAAESARVKPLRQAGLGVDSAPRQPAVATTAKDSGTSAPDTGLARRTLTASIVERQLPQLTATGQPG